LRNSVSNFSRAVTSSARSRIGFENARTWIELDQLSRTASGGEMVRASHFGSGENKLR
jgi:hypothetical protein